MDEHDTIYKLLFAHDRMIQDLLVGFLPDKWVAALDLESLEKMNGSYVTDDLRGRHGDAVWRIRWGEEWLYVYLLLEFQSSVDRFMALRIMVYTGLLHQDLIRRGELGVDCQWCSITASAAGGRPLTCELWSNHRRTGWNAFSPIRRSY